MFLSLSILIVYLHVFILVLQVTLRLYAGNNSASLMTSDRGNSGAAELELNNAPVSHRCNRLFVYTL